MAATDPVAVLYVDDDPTRAATVAANLQRADGTLTVRTVTARSDPIEDALGDADCVVGPCDPDRDDDSLFDSVQAAYAPQTFVLFAVPQNGAADAAADGPPPTEYSRLAARIHATVDAAATATQSDDQGTDALRLERYHAAFEGARDAMVVTDDDGRFLDANGSACRLFDRSLDDLLGSYVSDFTPADDDVDDEWLAIGTEGTATGTFPVATAEGDRRLVEYAATADIVPGEHLAVLRDVTERTRLQEALQTEQNALREMYRITADRDAAFESKLRRLLSLGCDLLDVPYGFVTEIDADTQTIVEARGDHPDLQPGASCPLSEAYCRKTVTRDEFVTVQNAVAEGWSDDPSYQRFGLGCYAGAEITVDGDTYGTFCFAGSDPRAEPFSETERTFVELMARWVSYELEQRRATARLERQNERLDEFASMVSHDLRSPLNVARGFLDLARDSGDAEHFDRVADAHDRIERIISDVLYLAREGQEIGATEPVDLAAAARRSWDVVAAEDTDATLAVSDDVGAVVADDDRLCQLLENLFRNAAEHAGPDVAVRVDATSDGFAVEDDGPGVPESERDSVFERGATTNEDGTGFGLYIVEKIADAHGWTVSVTDAEHADSGARFEFAGVDRGT